MMKLADYLNVPYRIESEALETSSDGWVRRVRHPELAGCSAQSDSIEDALTLLERQRIERIVDLLRAGEIPPTPRAPLAHNVTRWTLRRLGLDDVARLLDRAADELATHDR